MCNLSKGIEEEAIHQGLTKGLAQGMQQATLSSIRNLMISLNMTEDQAMAALQLSDTDKEKYRELLLQEK